MGHQNCGVWVIGNRLGFEPRDNRSNRFTAANQYMKDLLQRKIDHKRYNAEKAGLRFLLTRAQVESLLDQAGITVHQWTNGCYNLARYEDQGDYAPGNCRFITHLENARERKVSDETRAALSRAASIPHTWWIGRRHSESAKRKTGAANAIKQLGEHNSQFGSYWITNGTENRKWRDSNGKVPEGFMRGRSCLKS